MLITGLCSYGTPVGVTELILMQNLFLCRTYPYNRLMCIQDSRRSYRTYAYAMEFNLFGGTRRYHRDYGTYTGISEHILVLQNLYWSQNLYLYKGLILTLQILYWYYRTYYCISDTEVPVGTTEHFTGT